MTTGIFSTIEHARLFAILKDVEVISIKGIHGIHDDNWKEVISSGGTKRLSKRS